MKCSAMYVGKQPANEKARINPKNGDNLPAFVGTRYTFLVNDWSGKNGDEVEELFGRTYTDKRESSELIEEIEKGAIKLGDIVMVNIRKSDINVNFFCRLETEGDPF